MWPGALGMSRGCGPGARHVFKTEDFPTKVSRNLQLEIDEILCVVDGQIQFLPSSKGAHWPFFFPVFPAASSLDRALDLLHLVFLNMMYEDVGHQWHWLKDFSYFSLFVRLPKLLSHGNVKCWNMRNGSCYTTCPVTHLALVNVTNEANWIVQLPCLNIILTFQVSKDGWLNPHATPIIKDHQMILNVISSYFSKYCRAYTNIISSYCPTYWTYTMTSRRRCVLETWHEKNRISRDGY